MTRRLFPLPALLAPMALLPALAAAHPMGRATVNRWSSLTATSSELTVVHVVDLAEIPAHVALADAGLSRPPSGERLARFRRDLAARVASGLRLTMDGAAVDLVPSEAELSFPAGMAGLPTIRLKITARVPLDGRPHALAFRDGGFASRPGWREVIARGFASSDVPETDRTHELTLFPADPAEPPADTTGARLLIRSAQR